MKKRKWLKMCKVFDKSFVKFCFPHFQSYLMKHFVYLWFSRNLVNNLEHFLSRSEFIHLAIVFQVFWCCALWVIILLGHWVLLKCIMIDGVPSAPFLASSLKDWHTNYVTFIVYKIVGASVYLICISSCIVY